MKKRMITLAMTLVMAMSLAVPAGAVETVETDLLDNTEAEMEMVQALFTHKDESQVFAKDGTDITDSFLAEHQANYDAGNFVDIIDNFKDRDLSASYPSDDIDGIMPLLTINHSASAKVSSTYSYQGTKYTYTMDVTVSGLVNDANGYYSALYKAVCSVRNRGRADAVIGTRPYGISMHAGNGHQFIEVKVSINNAQIHVDHWTVNSRTSSNTLSCVVVPNV